MKFLCLGYLNVEAFDRQPESVKNAVLAQCEAHCLSMRATGKILMEEGVEAPSAAKSIRPENGKPTVTDGPFLNIPEQLGSFFIVEATSIDEAVAIASKHPAALLGEEFGFGIEVRPIQEP